MILVLGYVHIARRSRLIINEISRNKVVVPEGAAGLIFIISQIISISWVFIYAELLYRAIWYDLIYWLSCCWFNVVILLWLKYHYWLLYFLDLIFYTIDYLYRVGWKFINVLKEVNFICCTLCIRVHWILLFIFISRF